jgi:dodecin
MTDKQSERVYRIIDVVGVSETSWEDAGRIAVETAAGSLRDLRVAEVTKMDMKVDNGRVTAYTVPEWLFRSNTSPGNLSRQS